MLVHLLFLSKGDYLKMLKLNVNVSIQIAVTKLSYKFKVDMSCGGEPKPSSIYIINRSLIDFRQLQIFESAFDYIWKSNGTIPSSYKSQEDSNLIYSAFAYIV
jgi:hypothetical protein